MRPVTGMTNDRFASSDRRRSRLALGLAVAAPLRGLVMLVVGFGIPAAPGF